MFKELGLVIRAMDDEAHDAAHEVYDESRACGESLEKSEFEATKSYQNFWELTDRELPYLEMTVEVEWMVGCFGNVWHRVSDYQVRPNGHEKTKQYVDPWDSQWGGVRGVDPAIW